MPYLHCAPKPSPPALCWGMATLELGGSYASREVDWIAVGR